MSSLRDKLGRLGPAAARVGPGRAGQAESSGEPAHGELDRLARALSRAIGADEEKDEGAEGSPRRPAVDLRALGFEPRVDGTPDRGRASHEPTAAAPPSSGEQGGHRGAMHAERARAHPGAWVRRRSVPWDDRLGRTPLAPAATADPHLLALLGLTPALGAASPHGALYLDTETTGLGGAGTVVFLVGLAWIEPAEHRVVLEQWIIESPAHEAHLLEAVRARIGTSEFVVSYNGRSFDVPLLRSRMVMNGLALPEEAPQLDLLHLVRRVHRHRRWRKTLGNVERHVLDFDRGPDVAGADVAQRYHHYARSGDASAIAQVVTHNENDVLALVALVGLYGEPLGRMPATELASMARTMHRAGDRAGAAEMASQAVQRGGGGLALRARADLAKARGDRDLALTDFEQLAREVEDPSVRLELAKLYEHHVRDPMRALAVTLEGTGEAPEALERRARRLRRKVAQGKAPRRRSGERR